MEHKYFKCKCEKVYCMFCHGGLDLCTVCKGFEGTLTTDCCGRPITKEEETKIYQEGTLNYKDGHWIGIDVLRRKSK